MHTSRLLDRTQTPRPNSAASAKHSVLSAALWLLGVLILAIQAHAQTSTASYQVEADSSDNSIYILLKNLNPGDSYDAISVSGNAPALISTYTASIVPNSVAANGSALAALDFDVAASASVGSGATLEVLVSGTVAGQTVNLTIPVELEVVAAAPIAQGLVGSGIPTPDPGGIDSDADGVSDALEAAFGSDPLDANSVPGQPAPEVEAVDIPIAGAAALGLAVLLTLFASRGSSSRSGRLRHKKPAERIAIALAAFSSLTLLSYPQDALAGNATRIQLVAEIPIPPPQPQLLSANATASSALAPAAYAVDDNLTTRWESAHGIDPQSLTLDFGSNFALTEIIVQWEAANAASYRIDGSQDGSNWTTGVANFSGGTWDPGPGVRRTDTLALSGSYRYLRLMGLSRPAGNVYGYSIWEVDVYGLAPADSDNDGVDDSVDQCPATPAASTVAENGCTDSDADGIDDNLDLCPATPANATVDSTGCETAIVQLSATATASSTGAAGNASQAVDNNLQTRWESAHGIDPSWLTLDLGAAYALDQVVIHWEAANAASYEIQGSSNNSSWTTLASQTGGSFGDRVDTVDVSGIYRYVRMNGLSRAGDPGNGGAMYGYSIWEMQVFGEAAVDTDGDGVPDSIDQCPGTTAGSNVDSSGCVIVDSDNDGVADGADLCPGTPPNSTVDATGCIVIIPVNEVTSINNILAAGSGASTPGRTLYVFDNDLGAPGASSCNGGCATSWPPLLVADTVASGVDNLGTILRSDGSTQATHNGRPLYYYIGDTATGQTNGDGAGGVWHTVAYAQLYVPLFDSTTALEPVLQEDNGSALITRLADRARDRHARESQFKSYDHFLSFYWEHRTAEIEIVDTVGHGGNSITFNVTTEWPLHPLEAELRFFHLQAAVYANNGVMTAVPALDDPPPSTRRHYTRSVSFNPLTGQPLQVGDRMEFELSQFLTGTPNGRDNYYGTAILYVVGQGVEPFEAENPSLNTGQPNPSQNPYPMPLAGRLGGDTTLNYQYSDEPDNHFMQMPTNLSNINGQTFVLGRRVHHTDFGDGSHDEAADNASFPELANKLGRNYINRSCVACHVKNGRGLPPATGQILDNFLVKVGDASGAPHPQIGSSLQPLSTSGPAEASVVISSWTESNGLRAPVYQFTGVTPSNFSARIAPQLVGMGLLEAIDEADIVALADESDSNGDGISGRLSLVDDAASGEKRIGRFGWKASQPSVKQQVAAALNGDIGVMTSLLPNPDCGSAQSNCGSTGSELSDQRLDELTAYISLLGVSARRDLNDASALQGETLFNNANCNSCHVDTFQTSAYHPHAELRSQTIHPYTDLLLHDMGPGLASTLSEGSAAGSEWRTAPLWNIGLTAGVSGGEGYLHDGRARTLHEAIMWHGGEAEASKQAYAALSASEQAALIAFLQSL